MPGICHQAGNLGNAADVFGTDGVGETKVPIEIMVYVVAIQQIEMVAHFAETLIKCVGNRRFPDPDRPVNNV